MIRAATTNKAAAIIAMTDVVRDGAGAVTTASAAFVASPSATAGAGDPSTDGALGGFIAGEGLLSLTVPVIV
jgi:hypothetical protein